ncbi:MAG: hypothetical protein Q4F28_08675 [Eubacteriales bacterium]|nr:hypothetical protein [Eubacteriales bacterium]
MVKMKMDARTREIYLEGLRRYRERGVRILLDGKEVEDSRWNVIFEVREDGSFYMGDYILEDEHGEGSMTGGSGQTCCVERQTACEQVDAGQQERWNAGQQEKEHAGRQVRESPAEYGSPKLLGKRLKEIRFDRVYNR